MTTSIKGKLNLELYQLKRYNDRRTNTPAMYKSFAFKKRVRLEDEYINRYMHSNGYRIHGYCETFSHTLINVSPS